MGSSASAEIHAAAAAPPEQHGFGGFAINAAPGGGSIALWQLRLGAS
jgi:hypothetical protein